MNQADNRVFLSHPVSDYVASDGTFRPEKQVFISNVIEALRELHLEVECAALNEDFGRIKLKPIQFTSYDVEAIQRSDILVLVTSERLTGDMYLEVGIALGLEQDIFFFVPASAHVSYMILGLCEMGKITLVKYDSEVDVPRLIKETIPPKGV